MQPDQARRAISMLAHHTPTEWYDFMNLSSAFFVLENTPLALQHARRAVSMQRDPSTLLNLAVILESQGDFYGAFSLSEEAYRLDPMNEIMACHYSHALLRIGHFKQAWPLYTEPHAKWIAKHIPRWDGKSSLRRKRILVLFSGGYGDNILFLRWLPRLAKLGAKVTFQCPQNMHRLLVDEDYIHDLTTGESVTPSDYAYHIPLFALAGLFCNYPEEIPTASYICPPFAEVISRRDFVRWGGSKVYGLCTRAGEESFPRRHRSLTDEQTHQIISAGNAKGVGWVGLNYNSILPGTMQPAMRDWMETAAVIANLDLVVTVDTGVAHLAGAMGKRTWVILPGISAAYYGIHGDRNLFYPSQRLFRNGGEGIDNSVSAVISHLEFE